VIAELEKQMAVMIGEKASYEQQLKGAGLDSETDEKLKNMDQRLQGIQRKIVEQKQEMMANEAAFDPMGSSAVIITQILQIETENTALLAKTNALRTIVAQYNRELDALPEKSLTLARLQREATVNQNIFMLLREKYEENRIVEAGQIGTVRIVDRAREPLIPIKPKKKLNLILGFMVGLGLGVGLTFLREYLDTSLKSMEDVERLGFSVLGSIPLIAPQQVVKAPSKTKVEINQIESRLVTHFAPKSPISEAYRTSSTTRSTVPSGPCSSRAPDPAKASPRRWPTRRSRSPRWGPAPCSWTPICAGPCSTGSSECPGPKG
jgi:tyrosine-protein kinase Etk/Wzc